MSDTKEQETALAAASGSRTRRDDARVVVAERGSGRIAVREVRELGEVMGEGDVVVVNDAATWPASLAGRVRGERVELRLVTGAFRPGDAVDVVVFGAGDWRTRTEHRAPPPALAPGDAIAIDGGPTVRVIATRGTRLATIATPRDDAGFVALYAAGRPVQYAHVARPLDPWDVQTAYAGRPWAVEMPSAGRPLSWEILATLAGRGVRLATLTHAAGLSSTGDAALDATLPWPERYEIPADTAAAIARRRGRVIAVGTTVVRALESAAAAGGVAPGPGLATLVLGPHHRPRVVDAVLSGLHEPTESHFRLLEAFAPRALLLAAWRRAAREGLESHELGDLLLVM